MCCKDCIPVEEHKESLRNDGNAAFGAGAFCGVLLAALFCGAIGALIWAGHRCPDPQIVYRTAEQKPEPRPMALLTDAGFVVSLDGTDDIPRMDIIGRRGYVDCSHLTSLRDIAHVVHDIETQLRQRQLDDHVRWRLCKDCLEITFASEDVVASFTTPSSEIVLEAPPQGGTR